MFLPAMFCLEIFCPGILFHGKYMDSKLESFTKNVAHVPVWTHFFSNPVVIPDFLATVWSKMSDMSKPLPCPRSMLKFQAKMSCF